MPPMQYTSYSLSDLADRERMRFQGFLFLPTGARFVHAGLQGTDVILSFMHEVPCGQDPELWDIAMVIDNVPIPTRGETIHMGTVYIPATMAWIGGTDVARRLAGRTVYIYRRKYDYAEWLRSARDSEREAGTGSGGTLDDIKLPEVYAAMIRWSREWNGSNG